MPRFGRVSEEKLSTVDWRLQLVLRVCIKIYDFSVLAGARGEVEQNQLFREGKSKLKYPESKHNSNPSKAVDLAPYPIDWSSSTKAIGRFYLMAGIVMAIGWIVGSMMGFRIRWGGDWDMDWELRDQNFDDLGHFEILEEEAA